MKIPTNGIASVVKRPRPSIEQLGRDHKDLAGDALSAWLKWDVHKRSPPAGRANTAALFLIAKMVG